MDNVLAPPDKSGIELAIMRFYGLHLALYHYRRPLVFLGQTVFVVAAPNAYFLTDVITKFIVFIRMTKQKILHWDRKNG